MNNNPDKVSNSDIGAIYCVGRNYAAHAKELNNPLPKEPIIFAKVRGALVAFEGDLILPVGTERCDYETEVAIQINRDLFNVTALEGLNAVEKIGIGLDLTLRDRQKDLKEKGHPWEPAKSFINSCPLSPLRALKDKSELQDLTFRLEVNGEIRQSGNLKDMLFPIGDVLAFISRHFPLRRGDLILTGTPAGVGPLRHDDALVAYLGDVKTAEARVQLAASSL